MELPASTISDVVETLRVLELNAKRVDDILFIGEKVSCQWMDHADHICLDHALGEARRVREQLTKLLDSPANIAVLTAELAKTKNELAELRAAMSKGTET